MNFYCGRQVLGRVLHALSRYRHRSREQQRSNTSRIDATPMTVVMRAPKTRLKRDTHSTTRRLIRRAAIRFFGCSGLPLRRLETHGAVFHRSAVQLWLRPKQCCLTNHTVTHKKIILHTFASANLYIIKGCGKTY